MATLPYGWNSAVPSTPTTQSPSGECHKWISDFVWLQGALGVSGGSMGGNKLSNGSFTTIPVSTSNWTLYDAAVWNTSASGAAGSAARVSAGSTASGGVYQRVVVQPDTSYDFCFTYKTLGGCGGYVLYELDSSGTPTCVAAHVKMASTVWTKVHQLFQTGSTAASVEVNLIAADSASNVWYDEVALTSNRGGHHRFPTSTPVGEHLPGRVAMVYVGGSSDINAITNPVDTALAWDTNNYQFRYYDAGSGAWRVIEDFIAMDKARTITSNIVFESAGGSIDGRKYRTDGDKLDALQDSARHVIFGHGEVSDGNPIPYPADEYVHAASSTYIRNGSMDYVRDDSTGDAAIPSAWVESGSSCYIRLHSAGISGSCCYVSGGSAGKYMYQDFKMAVSAGSADANDLIMTYEYQPSSTVPSTPQIAVWDLNNLSFVVAWSNMSSATSGTWTASARAFTQPTGCISLRAMFAASGAGQQVFWDSIDVTKWTGVPITPASCETIRWIAGIKELANWMGNSTSFFSPWMMDLQWYEDTAGDELLTNGDFETYPLTDNWSTTAECSIGLHKGGYSGSCMVVRSGLTVDISGLAYQTVKAASATHYLTSFRQTLRSGSNSMLFGVESLDLESNATVLVPVTSICSAGSATWVLTEFDYTTPSDCASLTVYIGMVGSGHTDFGGEDLVAGSVDCVSTHATSGQYRKVKCRAFERRTCTCDTTEYQFACGCEGFDCEGQGWCNCDSYTCTCDGACYLQGGIKYVSGLANYMCVGVRNLT